jgi:hypothetical protein
VKEEVGIDTFPWSDQVGDNAKSKLRVRVYWIEIQAGKISKLPFSEVYLRNSN